MKTKIVNENLNLYYPMVKLGFFSKWKYLSFYDCQFHLHNSRQDYRKNPRVLFIDEHIKAKELLDKYIKHHERK